MDPLTPQQPAQEPTQEPTAKTDPETSKADSEAAYWRRQAAKYEKQAKELEKAGLSESERYKLERDEALQVAANYKTKLDDTAKRQAFEVQAKAAGVIDPDAAYLLAQQSAELTLTDGGKLMGADKALQELKKLRPYLFSDGGKLGSGGGITRTPEREPKKDPQKQVNAWLRA